MTNPIEELAELQKAYREAVESKGQAVLDYLFKDLFESAPAVQGVVWEQYTPYFNDGDACVFSIGEPRFLIQNDDPAVEGVSSWYGDDYDDEDGLVAVNEYEAYQFTNYEWEGTYPNRVRKILPISDVKAELFDHLQKVTTGFGAVTDVLENLFGDHVRIKATRSGYDVTEYDHD